MAWASALPKFADGDTLVQQIALRLKQDPAFILISGCDTDSCNTFLNILSAKLSGTGRAVNLHSPASSANFFDLVANTLGFYLEHPSATSLAKHLDDGNTYLLYSMGEKYSLETIEQLRQLSNFQPKNGYLSIILCGGQTLPKKLPNALRQRITDTYRLNGGSNPLRNAVWGLVLIITLCMSAWLAYSHFPGLFSTTIATHSTPLLGTSLKTGPVLAQPPPIKTPPPLTHIFHTEAEAEAALQAQIPANKPD